MSNIFKLFSVFIILLILILVVTKPSEQQFLNRIVQDYSNMHPDMQLSSDDLLNMGSTQYRSQLIFSSYKYKFGSIEVSYWGVLGNIFSNGYKNDEKPIDNSAVIDV
jgi:alpha-N-acetylglucosamine transferase